jgi:hypothetical protein
MGNYEQARKIIRYHRHLQRLGRARSVEESARLWISKYAELWRKRNGGVRAAA